MVKIKTAQEIKGIRKSSLLARQSLDHTASFIAPGISTGQLDKIAHEFIIAHHAFPASLKYNGFPKSICTSVNDVVCHGIPSKKHYLVEGDIINIDITTILDGYYGDVSETYPVGKISQQTLSLINHTRQALELVIKRLTPGLYLNDCVGKVIEPYVKQFGYSVVRDLGGHGVGLSFHEDPFVFHFDTGGKQDTLLRPGMIFTVEPMVNSSTEWRVKLDQSDGWTIRTLDSSLSAQFEHTILITDTGCEVLTKAK